MNMKLMSAENRDTCLAAAWFGGGAVDDGVLKTPVRVGVPTVVVEGSPLLEPRSILTFWTLISVELKQFFSETSGILDMSSVKMMSTHCHAS